MTIPIQRAQAALAEFGAPRTANLFAQAQAKHVLHEVRELPANFPAFDPALDEKVTFAAYSILAAACSVIEQGDRTQGVSALERAASLLQYAILDHGNYTRHLLHPLLLHVGVNLGGVGCRVAQQDLDVHQFGLGVPVQTAGDRALTGCNALWGLRCIVLNGDGEPS